MTSASLTTGRSTLRGLRVLVTRPRHQAATLMDRLRELGAEPIALPTIEIAPLDDFSQLDAALARQYDWVIFTSANTVGAVFDRLGHIGRPQAAGVFGAARIAAVGPATARALADHGVTPDFVPVEHVADAIAEGTGDPAGQRILLPQADIARQTLAERLRTAGATVDEVVAYRTIPAASSAEELRRTFDEGIDVVTFLSPSSVRNFAALASGRHLEGVLVACVGPITAATARELGIRVDVTPAEHTAEGLVEAIARRAGEKP